MCAQRLCAPPPLGALQSSSPTRSLPSRLWLALEGAKGRRAEGGEPGERGAAQRGVGGQRPCSPRDLPWGPFALAPGGRRARGGGSAQPGAPRAAAAAAKSAGGGCSLRAFTRAGAGGRGCQGGCGLEPPPLRPWVPEHPVTAGEDPADPDPARHAPPLDYLFQAPWEPPARCPVSEPAPRGGIPSRRRPLRKCKRSVTLTGS